MLAIYILVVYLYIGIAVGFYNYLSTPSHKQVEHDEFKKNCDYWRTQYNCKGGENNGN